MEGLKALLFKIFSKEKILGYLISGAIVAGAAAAAVKTEDVKYEVCKGFVEVKK